ncbi:hypothetical protein NJB1604_39390 [Mycobacterium marinum]|uniref:hypothetical protein n=1 Tax=Mycobacterium marinum TaxID=1781 RepID=UPI0021C368E5|nr:hypothetical protein [Mycobacterium marinum]GJO51399.1 hypothetical protein NJB1604_39390 [Mycobacterium marinum]
MADARFPFRWMTDPRIQQEISGDQFRALMNALTWSATNGTDGVVRAEHLPLIARLDRATMAAFVKAGLCAKLHDGWLFVDYRQTQTSRAQLESAARTKANNRERQARKRLRDLADQNDVTRDVTRDSVGKARQGKASYVSSSSPSEQSKNQPGEKDRGSQRFDNNNGEPYNLTPRLQARIDDTIRRGYES